MRTSFLRGEAHPSSKLTADQVQEIRRSYPAETSRQLAARFGLSRRYVSDIVAGAAWAWLPLPEPGPPRAVTCIDCELSFEPPLMQAIPVRCPLCAGAYNKARDRAKANLRPPSTTLDERRDYEMQRKFGISLGVRDQIVEIQHGVCAICKTPEADVTRGRLHVDHDHRTGLIRGMLCSRCNLLIGLVDDNAAILREAIYYLELGQ